MFEATLKRAPEDFVVDELMDIVPDGHGEHLWVHIEKRGLDTEQLRRSLAEAFGVADRDVGHAGLKDKWAVTRQWLSTRVPAGVDEAAALARFATCAGLSVLHAERHTRKLRIGAHSGNAFRIRLHDACAPGGGPVERAALDQRVAAIVAQGFPNRFGAQRFGADGRNVDAARAMLGGRSRRTGRLRRSLLLSAARSHLFNRVLDQRIAADSWLTLMPGEPAMLAGSRSMFVPEPGDHDVERRLLAMDISPSGPMPGGGDSKVQGECAAWERKTLADEAALCEGLGKAGVEAARRPLRIPVPDLQCELDGATVALSFSLPPGSYATSLLDAIGQTSQATST